MKKMVLAFLVILLLCPAAKISLGEIIKLAQGAPDNLAEPMLLSPLSPEVVVTDTDTIEFKWLTDMGHYFNRDYYDFRIYNGYEMTEQTLLYKDTTPAHKGSIEVNADLFKPGQVYTWCVRHVVGVVKSDRSYKSFKAK